MSGVIPLRETILSALRDDAALMALVNVVADGGAAKVTAPAVLLGQCIGTEWGAKGLRGLSVRVPLTLIDRAERPERLSAMAACIEAVMDGLPELAGDWRIGTVLLNGTRTVRGGDGQWTMLADYLVRLSRLL
ncbi:MAG TPA: DUF3168 domain-containing protein [Sphingobium sp.]|uniref:DUF3168 domain-containing protein n=1 Tax=Sphingobium sp. TaxID=1912891 RepID=UPI002ED15A57